MTDKKEWIYDFNACRSNLSFHPRIEEDCISKVLFLHYEKGSTIGEITEREKAKIGGMIERINLYCEKNSTESAIKCLIEGSLVFEESRLGLLKRQLQEMPQDDTASKNYINQTIQPEIEMREGVIKKLNSALNKTDELLDNIELVESENKRSDITPHITYSLVYQGYDGIVGYQNSRQFYHPSIENTNMKSIEDSKEIVTFLPSQSKSSSNMFFSTDKNVNH